MNCKICNAETKQGNLCYKHKYLAEKQRDPIGLAYRTLRSNAKRRGKEFSLTKEQFLEFCVSSEYLVKKGIHKDCFHIDRIDETKGYSIDNIQVLTNTQNIRKYAKWVSRDEHGVCKFTTQIQVDTKNYETDAPF